MITLKDTLNKIITENQFIEEALHNNFLNLTSFAEYIKPQVEKISKKEVTISALKMTLSRISKEQLNIQQKAFRFNFEDFFVRKDISIVTLEKNLSTLKFVNKIYKESLALESEYLSITQWVKEISIIFSKNLKSLIFNWINEKYIKYNLENLWMIWIHLSKEMMSEVWMFYDITKKMAFYNINILEIISTYTEIALILEKKDLQRWFEILSFK